MKKFLTALALVLTLTGLANAQTLVNTNISTAGTDCAVATNCAIVDTANIASIGVSITLGVSGTFQFEASMDASRGNDGHWFAVQDDVGAATSTTGTGQYYFKNPGFQRFRIRASALSGAATISMARGFDGLRAAASVSVSSTPTGTAGTPNAAVVSVQGIAGGTALPVTGTFSGTADTTGSNGALGALNNTITVALAGEQGASFHIPAATLVGTIVPEVSFDGGTTYPAATQFVNGALTPSASVVFGSANTATDLAILIPGGATHARVRVSAYTSGTVTGHVTATSNNTPLVAFSVPQHVVVDTAPTTAVTGTFFQATQPVSATALPLPTGAAADSSVTGLEVAQGSTTSGQKGVLGQAAVTTAAPTYTNAQTAPLSVDTAGNLRVVTSGSASNAAASATGSAVPSSADYTGINIGGTLTGQTGKSVGSEKAASVAIVDGAGAQVTSFGATSTDRGTFTFGTTPLTTIGGVYNSSITSLTAGQTGALASTPTRDLHVALFDGSGTALGGQKTMSGSIPVVLPSDQFVADINGSLQTAATANGNGSTLATGGLTSVMLTVNCATCSGGTTINFEGTEDSTNYTALQAQQLGTNTIATSTTTSGLTEWEIPIGSVQNIRARISGYSAGTVTITGHASAAEFSPRVVNTNVITVPSNQSVNLAQVSGSSVAVAATGIAKVGLTDGTGNAITSTSNAIDVNIKSGAGSGGTAATDEATYTQGTTSFTPMGGIFTNSITNLTSGQAGTVQLTNDRMLFANLGKIAGTVADVNSGNKSAGTLRVVIATDQPSLTNKLLVTPDANSSVNVSQINGVTPLMGNGVSGTGAQRVTIASDSTGQIALAAGAATIGSLAANQSTNEAQINGVAPSMGNGTSGTGVQRVTIASDSTGQIALAAGAAVIGHVINDAGSALIGKVSTDQTTHGTSDLVASDQTKIAGTTISVNTGSSDAGTQRVIPADGVSECSIVSAASNNATNCKASAGNFLGLELYNTTTTVYYLRLYNTVGAPTCSSATGFIRSIPVPPAAAAGQVGGIVVPIGPGVAYGTGVAFCLTGGSSSTDNTNAAVGIFGALKYR